MGLCMKHAKKSDLLDEKVVYWLIVIMGSILKYNSYNYNKVDCHMIVNKINR